MKEFYITDSSGLVEIKVDRECIEAVTSGGPVDDSCNYYALLYWRQFSKYSEDTLRKIILETGLDTQEVNEMSFFTLSQYFLFCYADEELLETEK